MNGGDGDDTIVGLSSGPSDSAGPVSTRIPGRGERSGAGTMILWLHFGQVTSEPAFRSAILRTDAHFGQANRIDTGHPSLVFNLFHGFRCRISDLGLSTQLVPLQDWKQILHGSRSFFVRSLLLPSVADRYLALQLDPPVQSPPRMRLAYDFDVR